MSDVYLDDGRRTYNESLPPALLTGGGGGGGGPVVGGDRTTDVASATGVDPATLANLATLKADATIGDGTGWGSPFPAGDYVVLGDASAATWDGSAWSVFVVPPAPPAPPPLVLDPATLTVAEVIAWVEDHYGDHDGTTPAQRAELQAILDAERVGLNRATLVAWLDALEGIV